MTEIPGAIAAQAARYVVEEGLEYGTAKKHAIKVLGLARRSHSPSNDEVEAAVFAYLSIFCADSQPKELRALRQLALDWMMRLSEFRPYLAGAVWRGTATRKSDIYLHLFCDDCKSAEMTLINKKVNYVARSVQGFRGEVVAALSLHAFCAELKEDVGVHLMIHDFDDMRGTARTDAKGRASRGDLQAVRCLLAANA